jgi:hypothetical protein
LKEWRGGFRLWDLQCNQPEIRHFQATQDSLDRPASRINAVNHWFEDYHTRSVRGRSRRQGHFVQTGFSSFDISAGKIDQRGPQSRVNVRDSHLNAASLPGLDAGVVNRTEVFDNRKVKGSEFLRMVRSAARRNKVPYRWVP